ncbi:SusC/RagA family TonB-linked outer membrane protein [Pedobacter sp. MR2016-24]|uniref:SusC/RagA family TonB-linked outer membrane protein n=1 Tax=Pedobacter sp. MR2016-24 TaxID=2994466 RepID=UPI0022478781|nr:TonB-dependent receptor [Pedobacter sp. MR2016-24]MCX2483554.1 TonB-dependent receptor [Pedobacter sp. MR2016-24]
MGIHLRAAMLFVIFLATLFSAYAQNPTTRQITGTVSDEKGTTLPGAGIAVKNSKTAVSTSYDGKYVITIPSAGTTTLVFSFIGLAKQEIIVGNRSVINVVLKTIATDLTDVVVIGYGNQKRGDVNGAISSVKAADIANVPQVSIDQMLQGRASGLTVTQNSGAPGSSTSVRVRGVTSLSLSNEPLYVVDGVPISGDATNQATSGRTVGLSPNNGESAVSPLSSINPSDIESIDILKDASATAIYGSRASNGVIIITTKRGKNGSARVTYDGYAAMQQQGKFLDVMDLQQYAVLQNALADVTGVQRRAEFADPALLGKGTDWQDEVFRNALMQNHQLGISGGKDGTDYYMSGGYLKQDGTILGSDYRRYTFRSNVNSQVKPWLKVGMSISGSRSNENQGLSNNTGVVYNALLSAPDQAVRNPDGSFAGPIPNSNQQGGQINPVAQALDITNTLNRSNLNGALYADLLLSKYLTLRSEVNGDFNYSAARIFTPTYQYGIYGNQTAKLQEYDSHTTYWGWKEYLTYTHTFNKKHNVTALLGYEVNESQWGGKDASVQNFLSNDLQTLGLGDLKTAIIGEYKDSQALQSYFARGIYTFNNKYSLTATIRSDRSSKFADGKQTGYFPAFAVSWRLSDEAFMEGFKEAASGIKLRVGYGQVGNQNVPNYQYGSALTPVVTGLGTGFAIDKVSNPNLKWETAVQTNVGIDFSLFKERINASFDYFDKTSKDFLFQKPLPAYLVGQTAAYSGTGVISPPYINGGKVSNKGFDFTVNSRNLTGIFKWNTTVIFSKYNNKVISLADGVPFIDGKINVSFLQMTVTRTREGGSIGEFYGYQVKDIFRTDQQLRNAPVQFGRAIENTSAGTWLGDIQYQDINNDGKIDELDQISLGNPNPKFTYGITNNFSFKSFDLSIFLNGSYGAKVLNALNYQLAGLSGLYQNQLASSINFWSPANPGSNIPAPRGGDNPNLKNSDRFIESGSFLRIQNVNLGYNLPLSLIRKAKLARLKVFVSAQNLYVFTKYKGLDPEVGNQNYNVFLTNVDSGRYPTPRTLTFGINTEF